jgi:hypothetical protein
MGGYGSGEKSSKKTTVEGCKRIEIGRVMREWFTPGERQRSAWLWVHRYTQQTTASITYITDWTDLDDPQLWLAYTIGAGDAAEQLGYAVHLDHTRPHYGGRRWWFLCPGPWGGRVCGQRVARLYLAPGGRRFACRHCYDLTYTSSQESDSRVSRLLADPAALHRLSQSARGGSFGDLLLVVKALQRLKML